MKKKKKQLKIPAGSGFMTPPHISSTKHILTAVGTGAHGHKYVILTNRLTIPLHRRSMCPV